MFYEIRLLFNTPEPITLMEGNQMSVLTVNARYKHPNMSSEDWMTSDPVLLSGEVGYERDTGMSKIGDGTSKWSELKYIGASVIPTNRVRFKVSVTSWDGKNVANRLVTVFSPGNSVTAKTESNGEALIETDAGTWTISLSVPLQYNVPEMQIIEGVGGRQTSVNFFMSEKTATVWTMTVDESVSNPSDSVIYTGHCEGFQPSYMDFANGVFVDNGWSSRWPYTNMRPCLLKNRKLVDGTAKVMCYLNPNDYTHDEDGTDVSQILSSGTDGGYDVDAMLEVSDIYYGYSNMADQKIVTFKSVPSDDVYKMAYSYKGNVSNRFYVGMYAANESQSKLRSLSGKTPSRRSLNEAIALARANGEGYEILNFYQTNLLLMLYLLRFKSLNSQTVLGLGPLKDSFDLFANGSMNTNGMNYGTSTEGPIKVNGIENFGAGRYWLIAGVKFNGTVMSLSDGDYLDQNTWTSLNLETVPTSSGFVNKMQWNEAVPFVPKETSGSSSTYYSDYSDSVSEYIVHGYPIDDISQIERSGVFGYRFYNASTTGNSSFLSRLCYNGEVSQ